jgi:hypothetical protein
MTYQAGQPVPWPVPPDWRNGVRESLAWLTEMLTARSGETQKGELRLAPRRVFGFDVIADGQARRVAEALVLDRGAKVWALPIWHDVQLLASAIDEGAETVPCRTDGFEFEAGGTAMLWAGVNQFEVVSIAAVGAGALTLAGTVASSWPSGTRLYPIRNARILDRTEEAFYTDDAGGRRVTFAVDEPCDWPAALPAATYRGLPVLEHRTDESDNPTVGYARQLDSVDVGTGPVHVYDFPSTAARVASHRWVLANRAEHAAFRSLAYGLRGRMAELWVPSMTSDLVLASAAAPGARQITIEWAAYALYGRQQLNRRDLRIELLDGTVLYRRITASVEAGAVELLTLDAPHGVTLSPDTVRQINFMAVCQAASDTVELEHVTDADGVTRSAIAFEAVKRDV